MLLLQLIVRWCLHSFALGFFGEGVGYLFTFEIAMKKILTSFAISPLSQNSFNISVIMANSDLILYFFNTSCPHMFLCILGFSSLLSRKNCPMHSFRLSLKYFSFFYYYEFSLDFMHPIEDHFFLSCYFFYLFMHICSANIPQYFYIFIFLVPAFIFGLHFFLMIFLNILYFRHSLSLSVVSFPLP